MSQQTLKAFSVTNENSCEPSGAIVFSKNARTAKSIAFRCGFDEQPKFTDLLCVREEKADNYLRFFPEGGIAYWSLLEARKMYRDLGWQKEDADICDGCGKFEDSEIEESKLLETEEGNLCSECRSENAKHELLHPYE